ncbi:hypothetical protein IC762_23700 [Bradyrhizobium genosp. L]|nr:hypothetical protein IC762_23700 [Bradyrhizobium genosp. L]
MLALFTVAGAGGASAQSAPPPPSATQAPPVAVKGWRYQPVRDLHKFTCDQPGCGAGSKVSYHLYAPNSSMTLDQFRGLQEQVAKALDQRVPGQKTSILAVEGDKGTAASRMFKVRRVQVAPNGAREYQVSGMLFGPRGSASLISSASSERDSTTNFAQFAVAVMVALGIKSEKKS